VANKSTSQDFQPGNSHSSGRKKGSKNKPVTVWMLESLAKKGYDFEKELVAGLKNRDFEMLDRLIKLAPHIANRPKETVGMEGIEGLVIKEFKEDDTK
jgi:hypothetical protein